MADWPASDYRRFPQPLAHRRWCRNGKAPDGRFISQVKYGLIHSAAFRKKIICEKVWGVNDMATGIAAVTDLCHWATHVGPQTSQIAILLNLAPADNVLATDPYVTLSVTPGFAGGVADTHDYHYGVVDAGPVTPDNCTWGVALFADVIADSDYRFKLQTANYSRILSFCCFEFRNATIDDTADGGINPTGGVDYPIHDNRTSSQLQAATKLWRAGGQQQLNWIRDSAALAPTFNSATYLNVADLVSGPGVAAGTPGVILSNAYHNSRGQDEVPMKMAFRGQKTNGFAGNNANNKARISDAGAANVIEVDTIVADGWYTATGTLPAGAGQKYDFQVQTDLTHTVRVDAFCVWAED